jgi:hypothetical protein
VRQAVSNTARVASRPPAAMQQLLVWSALRASCGVAALCQYSSSLRDDESACNAADDQLLQTITDDDALLAYAASLGVYVGLLHRELRGKSPLVTAGGPNTSSSSSSSSPAAASRRRQQQLKCVPKHHSELLQLLGTPALVNAPKDDGHSDEDESAQSLVMSCETLVNALLRCYMRLEQHDAAPSFPSKQQQLLHKSIVAVVGELAMLAPEPKVVMAARQLAIAVVTMYMHFADAAEASGGPSEACIADAVLAQLFSPMAQLISPALLHVADCSSRSSSSSSSSSSEASTADGDSSQGMVVFNLVLGVCAKCAFDSNSGEGRWARTGRSCILCICISPDQQCAACSWVRRTTSETITWTDTVRRATRTDEPVPSVLGLTGSDTLVCHRIALRMSHSPCGALHVCQHVVAQLVA